MSEPLYKDSPAADSQSTTPHHGGGTQTNVWFSL